MSNYRRILDVYRAAPSFGDGVAAAMRELPEADREIVRAVVSLCGATAGQIEDLTGLKHQTVSANIRHMVEAGLLEDRGERRTNENHRRCVVWQLAAHKVQAVA